MTELRYSKSARRHILDASIFWRTHHTAIPNLFDDELSRAPELIRAFPDIAPRTLSTRFKDARKLVPVQTGHLLIYRREGNSGVRVLALLVAKTTTTRP